MKGQHVYLEPWGTTEVASMLLAMELFLLVRHTHSHLRMEMIDIHTLTNKSSIHINKTTHPHLSMGRQAAHMFTQTHMVMMEKCFSSFRTCRMSQSTKHHLSAVAAVSLISGTKIPEC